MARTEKSVGGEGFEPLPIDPFWWNRFEDGEAVTLTCMHCVVTPRGVEFKIVLSKYRFSTITDRCAATISFERNSPQFAYDVSHALTDISFANELALLSKDLFPLPKWSCEFPGVFAANPKGRAHPPHFWEKGSYTPAHLRKPSSPVDNYLSRRGVREVQRSIDHDYIDLVSSCMETQERGYYAPKVKPAASKAKPWAMNGDILGGICEEEDAPINTNRPYIITAVRTGLPTDPGTTGEIRFVTSTGITEVYTGKGWVQIGTGSP